VTKLAKTKIQKERFQKARRNYEKTRKRKW